LARLLRADAALGALLEVVLGMMVRVFGHYVSRAYLLLGMAEFLACMLALLAGAYLRFGSHIPVPEAGTYPLWYTAVLFGVLMVTSMVSVGLYQRGLRLSGGLLVRIGLSFLFSSMAISLSFYALPELFVGRGVLGYAILVSLLMILMLRTSFYRITSEETRKHRVLVLGTGRHAQMIRDHETDSDSFTVIGYVHLHDGEDEIPAERRVHLDKPLLDFVVAADVDELVIAVDDRRRRLPVQDLLDCKMHGVKVLDLPSFFEKEGAHIRIDMLTPGWLLTSSGFRVRGMGQYGKRLFDLLASLLGLLVATPLMLLTAMAIVWESGWRAPVFYHQMRVGMNGKPFQLYKFRSMRTDAEADGVARWAQENDDRVTRVGRFIRKTRLDELPQLFNVLRGDMSLVGPRPERPEFVEQFEQKIPFYNERHRVRPGVTGWAQLSYQYGSSEDDAREKLQYDLYYIKNTNFFLDLIILLETVEVILWGKGAR
jgi:sugar transferase (PEP-CTERM system associated)